MKKLTLALALALLLALPAAGQTVGASQVRKKANAGLVADSANALAVGVYRGTSAPASPVTGQLWCDTTTTPCTLKTFGGATWTASPTYSLQLLADLTSLPENPTDGQVVWVRSMKRLIVYDASAGKWYFTTNDVGGAEVKGAYTFAGAAGGFLANPGATTGSLVAGGSMTAGTHVCAVTHYGIYGGETLPGGTTAVLTTGGGNNSIALTFAASGTGVYGKRVYCSKADVPGTLYLVTSIDDTTTGTYTVTVGDSSFGVHQPPDRDFSATFDTGWTAYIPSRLTGGCGRTSDSIICRVLSYTAGTGAAGPRVVYGVSGNTWRARFRMVRYAPGFGTTAAQNALFQNVAVATTDVGTPSALAKALTSNNGWNYATAAMSFKLAQASRAQGAGWSASGLNWQIKTYCPFWVQIVAKAEGSNVTLRFAVGMNGVDYDGNAAAATGSSECANNSSFCLAMPNPITGVGLALEGQSLSAAYWLEEIDSFTWTSE